MTYYVSSGTEDASNSTQLNSTTLRPQLSGMTVVLCKSLPAIPSRKHCRTVMGKLFHAIVLRGLQSLVGWTVIKWQQNLCFSKHKYVSYIFI